MKIKKTVSAAFRSLRGSLAAVSALAFATASAQAGSITVVPNGLAPGAQYRLAFITNSSYAAVSSTISTYNSDVSGEATAVTALNSLGTTWTAIASTSAVNAIDNIGQDAGVPIYDLEGHQIAVDATTGTGGLFSGTLMHALSFTVTGADSVLHSPGHGDSGANVWTGSTNAGVAGTGSGSPLGSSNGTLEAIGDSSATNGAWIHTGGTNNFFSGSATTNRLYGISGVLTVADTSAPEPGSAGLIVAGLTALVLATRRRD